MVRDFEYAGERLSDYGCIIGAIDGSSGSDILEWGNQLDFNTITTRSTSINRYSSTSYNDVYTVTFQVVKYDCDSKQFFDITDVEYRKINSWLNRKSYEKFVPLTDDDRYGDCYFMGSFNISPIIVSGKIAGLELTFTADAPYGYGDLVEINESCSGAVKQFNVYSTSDETGALPLYIKVTLAEDDNVRIRCNGKLTLINNCKKGEIITLDVKNRIIQSSLDTHTALYNDFNYVYPQLINEYGNSKNVFRIATNFDLYMSYTPIRKIGVIV